MHQCSASNLPAYENKEENPYFPPVIRPFVKLVETLEMDKRGTDLAQLFRLRL